MLRGLEELALRRVPKGHPRERRAVVHDSQVVDELLTSDNTASGVWTDSAYRSKDTEAKVKARGLTSRIHRKGYRNHPLHDWEKAGNRSRSRFRAQVEHVFGAQPGDMGGLWFAASVL